MSDDQPVILEGIPVFTGDLALLDTKVTALAKGGAAIATAAGDVHNSFGGLRAFYKAPEAEQLFATTKPVTDTAASLKSDLSTITGALSTYSDDAYPLVEKLKELKRDGTPARSWSRSTLMTSGVRTVIWSRRTTPAVTGSARPGPLSRRWSAPATTRSWPWSEGRRSRSMTVPARRGCTAMTPRL